MQETKTTCLEIKLVGLKRIRTSNEAEFNPEKAQIGVCLQQYAQENYPSKIENRKTPGKTFAVYSEYESDYKGKYSWFIGEEVTEFGDIAEGMESLCIPAQIYSKFTTDAGMMPNVVIEAWQKIWQMDDANRNYKMDFEVYDQRAQDPANSVVDIYIGLTK